MFHVPTVQRSNGSRSRLEFHQTRKRINKQPALFWTCQYACKGKIWYIPYGISNMDTYGILAVFSYGISTMVYQIRYEYGEMIWNAMCRCYMSLLQSCLFALADIMQTWYGPDSSVCGYSDWQNFRLSYTQCSMHADFIRASDSGIPHRAGHNEI